jgi:hypothetical protein
MTMCCVKVGVFCRSAIDNRAAANNPYVDTYRGVATPEAATDDGQNHIEDRWAPRVPSPLG